MSDLMAQGVNLTVLGVGTVFLFLTILVGATALMSRLVAILEPEPPAPVPETGEDAGVLAAAVVAVDTYRKQRDNRSK